MKTKLNTIQNSALRLATGALRCTTVKKLEVEAHVLPLQKHREYMSFNYGIKILADDKHPTRPCLSDHNDFEFSNTIPFSRRLYDISSKYNVNIYNVDHDCVFPNPPWTCPKFKVDLRVHSGPKAQIPIEMLRSKSLEEIDMYKDTEHYYTDGSVW